MPCGGGGGGGYTAATVLHTYDKYVILEREAYTVLHGGIGYCITAPYAAGIYITVVHDEYYTAHAYYTDGGGNRG